MALLKYLKISLNKEMYQRMKPPIFQLLRRAHTANIHRVM